MVAMDLANSPSTSVASQAARDGTSFCENVEGAILAKPNAPVSEQHEKDEKMAIRLQAFQRGRAARRLVASKQLSMKASSCVTNFVESSPIPTSMGDAIVAQHDQERCAVRIQALQRGRLARKHMALAESERMAISL